MINSAGPKPSSTVPQPLPLRIGSALISTLCSIRKRSSPSSTKAGSVVVNVLAGCGVRAAPAGVVRLAPGADAASAGGQGTGAVKLPSMSTPWL